jgi:hypothetical protein
MKKCQKSIANESNAEKQGKEINELKDVCLKQMPL